MAEQNPDGRARDPLMLAAAGFAVGLVAGLFLKDAGGQMVQYVRRSQWRHEHGKAVTYDENLPEPLARREVPGQPRYGGTGALGVPPTAARKTH